MAHYLVTMTAPAERDLQDIFLWSETEFGTSPADRYEALIAQEVADLLENPFRPGAKHREDLLPGIYTYHLALRLHMSHKPKELTVYVLIQAKGRARLRAPGGIGRADAAWHWRCVIFKV